MNASRIKTIAAKELKDALRDRRTILAMIVIPILILPVLMFLPAFLASPQQNPVKVAVIQADSTSDDFISSLASNEIRIVKIGHEENLTRLIQSGEHELGISLPPAFSQIMEGSDRTARITIFVDQSSTRGTIALGLVQEAITDYANKIVSDRLSRAGLPPRVLSPIETDIRSVSVNGPGAILIAILLPMFLGIYAVTGAMYFVMDTTAGEKERKTLEALLTMPATRTEIVLGKFLIAVLIALISAVLSMIGMTVGTTFMLGMMSGSPALGLTISTGNLLLIGLATLVLAMTSASLEMMISIFARSFKEAQNLLSPLTIVIVIPAVAMQYLGEQALRSLALAPVFNTMLIIRDALLDRISLPSLTIEFGSAFVYMIITLAIAIQIFKSEKAMVRY